MLLIIPLDLLSKALSLIVVLLLLTTRAVLVTMWRAVMLARASLRLKLPFMVTQFTACALQTNSLVNHGLEVWEDMALELVLDGHYHSIQEPLLLLPIGIRLSSRVPRQLDKLVPELTNRHSSLLQIQELLQLEFHHSLWDTMSMEDILKISPSDSRSIFRTCNHKCIPPVECCPFLKHTILSPGHCTV